MSDVAKPPLSATKREAKNILVLNGPGFFEQDDVIRLLEGRGDRVVRVTPQSGQVLPGLENAAAILMRGPWTPSPEDRLWATSLASKLTKTFEAIHAKWLRGDEAPLLLGIGRGALIALASPVFGFSDFANLEWKPMLSSAGSWVDVKAPGLPLFPALVTGRACPQHTDGKIRKDLLPWLMSADAGRGDLLGLSLDKKLRLSFLDILAFGDRTQFPDFGYRDLVNLPLHSQVLFPLVDGEL